MFRSVVSSMCSIAPPQDIMHFFAKDMHVASHAFKQQFIILPALSCGSFHVGHASPLDQHTPSWHQEVQHVQSMACDLLHWIVDLGQCDAKLMVMVHGCLRPIGAVCLHRQGDFLSHTSTGCVF